MKTNKVPITYLTLDSLSEGVGASQVREYVLQLASNFDVTLVSFEKNLSPVARDQTMESIGIHWKPKDFGDFGLIGAIKRAFNLLRVIPVNGVIHARSDFCAALAILKGNKNVIWDCRALLSDHRRATNGYGFLGMSVLIFRILEFIAAKGSKEIIVITHAVVPVLVHRYKLPMSKFHVIPTCVNLNKFQLMPLPSEKKCSILIAGTLSPAYDIKLMNLIIVELRKRISTKVTVALGKGHDDMWKGIDGVDELIFVPHSEMPTIISQHKAGLAIWKKELGVCLTSVAATKFAEFLAVGRPVIVNYGQGDIGRIVQKYQVGVSTVETDEQMARVYANQLLALLEEPDLPQKCRAIAERYFNLGKAVEKISVLYLKVYQSSENLPA